MRGQPRARSAGLVVRDLRGEVVVYDTGSHRAHCLNATAAFVFRHADGRRSAEEIAALLGPSADEELVHGALEQLGEAGLLEPHSARPESGPSRREVLRQVGLGAALLAPVVTSLLVPTPAEAAVTCVPAAACPGPTFQRCYHPPSTGECDTCTCTGAGTCTC